MPTRAALEAVKTAIGSALSRSTSPGSCCTEDSRGSSQGLRETVARHNVIPDYDYPVPIIIKNTFLNTEEWRPSSLDGFFAERQIQSCVSRLGDMQNFHVQERTEEVLMEEPSRTDLEEFFDAMEEPQPSEASANVSESRRAFRWADESLCSPKAVEPAMLPTIGSKGHFDGSCKPCAFFHTKGCMQAYDCEFCHLCDAGERKKRRKEKIALLREMRVSAETLDL